MTEKEDAKLRGMMLWMAECPDRYSAICGEDYEPDAEKFLQLLEELEERGYYELMLIWTMKNNINNMVDRALSPNDCGRNSAGLAARGRGPA